jgi:glutamine amidotransferase
VSAPAGAREVVLVDYGAGNLRSLRAALERAGARVVQSADPAEVAGARRLMVPGQGAAGTSMRRLGELGLIDAVRSAVADGAYLLGVCVGLQLLYESSAEDETTCFGFLPGRVERLVGVAPLPHMGWNEITPVGADPVVGDGGSVVYFAHSYAVSPDAAGVVATTEASEQRFGSVVRQERIVGAQFHPERSSAAGRGFLQRFLELSDAA